MLRTTTQAQRNTASGMHIVRKTQSERGNHRVRMRGNVGVLNSFDLIIATGASDSQRERETHVRETEVYTVSGSMKEMQIESAGFVV